MLAHPGLHRLDARGREALEHNPPQLVMARRIDRAEGLADAHRRIDGAVSPRRGKRRRIRERPAHVLVASDQPEPRLLRAVRRVTISHLLVRRIRVPHESGVARIEPECHGYWPNLRLRSLMSFAHLSESARITCAKSSGEPGRISRPMTSNLATTSGSASARRASALSFATMGAGVPSGASKPPQVPTT